MPGSNSGPEQIQVPPFSTAFDAEAAGPWYVLHTRSRQEKALAEDLASRGVWHFLPVVREARHYGKRKVFVETPLFSGYLFLRGSLEDAYLADRTRRVAHIIRVPDQKKIEWELQNIFRALSSNATLDPYPYLTKGIAVEVRSGPFRGLQGIVADRARNDRLILQVDMLGRAVSLEIDGALLEPLG